MPLGSSSKDNNNNNNDYSDDDPLTNPWENAVNDNQWSSAAFGVRNVSEMTNTTHVHDGDDEEFVTAMVRHWLYVFHIADLLAALVLLLLALLEKLHEFVPFIKMENKTLQITFYVLSGVLFLRGAYACIPLLGGKPHWVGAYKWSGRTSLLLCGCYTIAGIEEILRRVFSPHMNLGDNDKYVWIVLLCLGLLEITRWVCVDNYRQIVTPIGYDDEDIRRAQEEGPAVEQRTSGRPWWLGGKRRSNDQHDSRLDEPLLGRPGWAHGHDRSYIQEEGTDQGKQGFFSRMFGGKPTGSGGAVDVRDDDDFASLQDDWASRSEEDPLWWSKEDGNNAAGTSVAGGASGTS